MTSYTLRTRFNRIPRRTTVVYDWQSEEGREFLKAVALAVGEGIEPSEVGELIGIRDFSSRWKIIGRGKG